MEVLLFTYNYRESVQRFEFAILLTSFKHFKAGDPFAFIDYKVGEYVRLFLGEDPDEHEFEEYPLSGEDAVKVIFAREDEEWVKAWSKCEDEEGRWERENHIGPNYYLNLGPLQKTGT